jgi:hypothetical protein
MHQLSEAIEQKVENWITLSELATVSRLFDGFSTGKNTKKTLKSIFISIICVCLIFSLLRETDFSKSIV